MSKYFAILSVLLFVFLATGAGAASASACTIVYGGGKTDCVVTTTPSVNSGQSATPTATPTAAPITQTKGGLPIQPTTNPQTTPNTGPEMLSLFSLFPMAAAGFYLRKKTK